MGLEYEYVEKNISDLLLDTENPRFASSVLVNKYVKVSQKVIIKHLLKYADVENLAKRINTVGQLHGGDLISCYKEDGKYIVIEGNRRVCACKLLLNRDLIPDEYKTSFPKITKDTMENITRVLISIYPNRESAQEYLSDRHIKGVKKWSALEKNNFYMNLYKVHKDVEKIKEYTDDNLSDIKHCIIQYNLFMDVFSILQTQYKDIVIEEMDYLPLVRQFMKTLVGKDKDVGLNLELDDTNYKYSCPCDKRELYDNILFLVGEAFLIRREKSQCEEGELCKIVSTEINNNNERRNLIINDERIPGLYKLIKEYKGITNNTVSEVSNDKSSGKGEVSSSKDTDSKGEEDETTAEYGNPDSESHSDTDSTEGPKANTSNGNPSEPNNIKGSGNTNNLPYFFTGLQYGHISPNDPLTHGIARICNEIRLFSNRKLVEHYPLSAAFLTRALIEHSLIYYSKRKNIQGQHVLIWEQVSDNGKVPKLSEMIKRYNKNLSNYIKDSNVRSYFKSLFEDYDNTTNPLNWVIHRPEEYIIPPNDLIQLPGKGLLFLINFLIS